MLVFFVCSSAINYSGQWPWCRDDIGDDYNSHTKNNDADNFSLKPPKYQTGVLRTNCIDCLDRTNVAQFAYGWAALGRQLHTIGYIDTPDIDLDSILGDDLMSIYEKMGDTLARQYGGSAAHNNVKDYQYMNFGFDINNLGNQLILGWRISSKFEFFWKKVNMVKVPSFKSSV